MFNEPGLIILIILAAFILVQLRKIKRGLGEVGALEQRLIDLQRELRQLAKSLGGPVVSQESPPPPPPIPVPQPIKTTLPVAETRVSTPPPPRMTVEPPESQSPAWIQAAQDILGRIWQWVLVGEEFRPKGVTMEYAVATTWLMRVGIVALVACAGYFLKWSLDNNLMGPTTRVAMSILFGVGMLGGGIRLLGNRWNVLGQGFVGGGLAILYFSMYALGPLYHLVDSMTLVFALMILVTISAGVLALYADSMLIAIFGLIGGFCTPILLSTGEARFMALFSYLLLLNLGILGIAHARQWRLLNYLGFVFTYAIYIGSLRQYQVTDFPVAITFLSLFFIAHSTLVMLYNLRRSIPVSLLEIFHLVLNAGLYSWFAYSLILGASGRPYPALMTLAIALYYVLHVAAFIHLKSTDRRLLVALIALAGFYTTLTMPLTMEQESLTLAWALQAFMFLWLGRRLDSAFLRQVAYAVYALTFVRLAVFEFPRFDFSTTSQTTMAAYGKALVSRLWTFGGAIGSVAAAFFLELRQNIKPAGPAEEPLPDTPDFAPASLTHRIFFWGAVAVIFLYLHSELYTLFGYFTPWRPAMLTTLWCAMALGFLLLYRSSQTAPFLMGLIFFAAGAVAKTLFWDLPGWNLCEHGYFNMTYTPFLALMRWLDFAAVLALLGAGAALVYRQGGKIIIPAIFGYTAIALLWLYMTTELYSLLHWKLREFEAGGISILWTLFAFSFITGGIWKRIRAIRIVGLILFAVVAVKVFMIDMAHMPAIYRVIALMIIGILLLLGSFAYLRASKKFIKEETLC
ncbi:MAG: DUF2339 domain-containing protein [bacterium]